MFRTASPKLLRRPLTSGPWVCTNSIPRRTLFTRAAKPRRGGFKSFAARWGIAGVGMYYYMTSNVFADEPIYYHEHPHLPSIDYEEDRTVDRHTILDDLAKQNRSSRKPSAASDAEDSKLKTGSETGIRTRQQGSKHEASEESAAGIPTRGGASNKSNIYETPVDERLKEPISPEELEEEADQQGAFNPETGEINWDCPCLGGMAHGPCGEEFKTAFSCFIFSEVEPKGVDCIEKFKGMQDCFRKFPDIYASEIGDDEDPADEVDPALADELEKAAPEDKSATPAPTTTTSPGDKPTTPAPATTAPPGDKPAPPVPVTTNSPENKPATPAPATTNSPENKPATPAPATTTPPGDKPATPVPVTTTSPENKPGTPAPAATTPPEKKPATSTSATTTATEDSTTKPPASSAAISPNPEASS